MNSTIDPNALTQTAESMRSALAGYTELVQRMAGDNLAGLTVFGAVLLPEYDPSRSAAASVLVLNKIDLKLLHNLAEQGAAFGRDHIRAPLVMTPDYINASLDTFPLEFLEIQQRHATLIGRNFFDDLAFEPDHMRLQCEREFKRILIQLRQGLLAAAGREKLLGELEAAVGDELIRTLRGLLWLKGRKEPLPRPEVLAEGEKLVDGSLSGLRTAIQQYGEHGWAEFTGLYEDVEKLAKVADEL
ncbi:MAG: hypothetical protein ABII12_16900 [Planctomycetota bacterium]